MDINKFNKEFNNLSDEAIKLRDQLIILSGGVLTIFVSIHGGTDSSSLIKYGFLFLGVSLVFGVLSIVLKLFGSFLPLQFDMEDLADSIINRVGATEIHLKEIRTLKEEQARLKLEFESQQSSRNETLLPELKLCDINLDKLNETEKKLEEITDYAKKVEVDKKNRSPNEVQGMLLFKKYVSSGYSTYVWQFFSLFQVVLFIIGIILIIFSVIF